MTLPRPIAALLMVLIAWGNLQPVPGQVPANPAPPPRFSVSSAAFIAPFALVLSADSADGVIRYTLDHSAPNELSPAYAGPLQITNTALVRAKVFRPGLLPSPIASACYFFLNPNVQGFSSDLPVMVVDNLGRGGVPTNAFQAAYLAFFEPAGGRSALTNIPHLVTRAGIHVRGSSTLAQPKKNFAVESWGEEDQDQDIAPLGLPADSDWILHAPYNFDRALIRNPLIFELSNQMGRYAVRTRFVELFVNTAGGPISQSAYAGVYVFMEKIKRGNRRVDVEKLLPEHGSEPLITGGYIVKIDRPDADERGFIAAGQVFQFVYPQEHEIAPGQSNWIRGYLDTFGRSLTNASWADPKLGYAQYFEVAASINHHILNEFAKNPDGLRLSTYLFKPRGQKLAMGPLWDFDRTLGPDDDVRAASPVGWSDDFFYGWWFRLFRDPDYWQQYIDRWQELRAQTFSANNLRAVIDGMAAELREAQARNFQKWRLVNLTDGWQTEINQLKTWVAQRLEWIDSQFPAPPAFNQAGGLIRPGFELSLSAPSNSIYYTLDGMDPRLPGGGISPKALIYKPSLGPITLARTTRVMARTYYQSPKNPWSAPAIGDFVLDELPELALTEIMYHPMPRPTDAPFDNDDFEFVELQNMGIRRLNLIGLNLQGGIRFAFPSLDLAPGQTVVVVKDLAAFGARYDTNGMIVAGAYDGNLNNAGEALFLQDAAGRTVFDFAYDDERGWTKSADGNGYSLEVVDPRADYRFPANWRASQALGGTPGASGFERLEVHRQFAAPGTLRMQFRGAAGRAYSVQYRERLEAGSWQILTNLAATVQARTIEVTDRISEGSRFYQVLSP